METDLEELGKSAKSWVATNKRPLFFIGFGVLLWSLLAAMKEVSSMLLLSYFLAVLLEPQVKKLERFRLSRSSAIVLVMVGIVLAVLLFLFVLIPPVISQYSILLTQLPVYAERLVGFLKGLLTDVGVTDLPDLQGIIALAQEGSLHLRPETVRKFFDGLFGVLLEGYSLTLMILNLTLLPFFLFYISVDLEKIHTFGASLLPVNLREKLIQLAREILAQIYAFLSGQITVSLIMAVLYALGLALAGVPSGLAIGFLAGILNVVPYLGVLTGLSLAIGSVLISAPDWTTILLIFAVFGVVQFIEGFFLTPKIVGERTGIPPLGVVLALLVGGQLLGLVGIIVALPAAAAAKVIFKFLWKEVRANEVVPLTDKKES